MRGARAIAGVRAVLTGADIGHRLFGRFVCDYPVLASETVRFIGDRVVAIAAETREIAEMAARAVEVRYETLPPLLDPRAATRPDAPSSIPASTRTIECARAAARRGVHIRICTPRSRSRTATPISSRFLHPLSASSSTPLKRRDSTPASSNRARPSYGLRTVSCTSNRPQRGHLLLRREMAFAIGVPEEDIVIEPSAIGGDFGGKGFTVDEIPCYFLARATGRPGALRRETQRRAAAWTDPASFVRHVAFRSGRERHARGASVKRAL